MNGYALIISEKGENYCKFLKGKKVSLTDESTQKNLKDLNDCIELKKFYENKLDIVKKYIFV